VLAVVDSDDDDDSMTDHKTGAMDVNVTQSVILETIE
jgi:hypothetical protein